MVAGFLVLGIMAGLGTSAVALFLGHALWVVMLAYMLGGMLGLSLGLIWGLLCERIQSLPGLGLYHRQRHEQ